VPCVESQAGSGRRGAVRVRWRTKPVDFRKGDEGTGLAVRGTDGGRGSFSGRVRVAAKVQTDQTSVLDGRDFVCSPNGWRTGSSVAEVEDGRDAFVGRAICRRCLKG